MDCRLGIPQESVDICQYNAGGRAQYKIPYLTKLDFVTFFLSRILNNFFFDLLSQQTYLTGDNVWFMNNISFFSCLAILNNRGWFTNHLFYWHLHLKPRHPTAILKIGIKLKNCCKDSIVHSTIYFHSCKML